jgi:protein-S-isoprenylcysteine O-methyltransferase Ste14
MKSLAKIVASLSVKKSPNNNPVGIIAANFIGSFVFLIIIPLVMYKTGLILISYTGDVGLPFTYNWINIFLILLGLCLRIWSSYTHYKTGRGSPLYTVPSRKLIVKGPYLLTRNPIMLGSMFYYLGLSLFFDSLAMLITIFVIPSIFGNLYHKLIEEKELLLRFGTEYSDYKENVPFLFPRIISR